jgi:Protein of unknown function (DUF3572)
MAGLTSIAYESRNGQLALTLKPDTLNLAQLADMCLQYLAQSPEQLAEFMVQSGIHPVDLRRLIGTHDFAHGLIDYVVGNEALLLAIAEENGLKPEAITRAWAGHHHREH